jgi:hypothetical protein
VSNPELPWRYALSASLGTSHARKGMPCQDACFCSVIERPEGGPVLVAVVTDGAGSALRAEAGAELSCSLVAGEIAAFLRGGGALQAISRDFVEDLLLHLQIEVAVRAQAEGHRPREYASTLVAAAVGTAGAVFFQVGDGAIVVGGPLPGLYDCIFWPAHGEHENFTYFATEANAADRLAWRYLPERIDEIALFSDGLERVALHGGERTARARFFEPLFAGLRSAADPSPGPLSAGLAEYLGSPEVTDWTHDDKTLVLASRRLPPLD